MAGVQLLRTCPPPGQRFPAGLVAPKALQRETIPKRHREAVIAATGGWVGQHYERGCKGLLLALLPPCDGPGSVRHVGDSSQTAPLRGRAKLSPKLQPPTIRQQGGQVPVSLRSNNLKKVGQAKRVRPVGLPPVGKGSGSVGMWASRRLVHHVHAVGALVHQAAQARRSCARSSGGGSGGGIGKSCHSQRPELDT